MEDKNKNNIIFNSVLTEIEQEFAQDIASEFPHNFNLEVEVRELTEIVNCLHFTCIEFIRGSRVQTTVQFDSLSLQRWIRDQQQEKERVIKPVVEMAKFKTRNAFPRH